MVLFVESIAWTDTLLFVQNRIATLEEIVKRAVSKPLAPISYHVSRILSSCATKQHSMSLSNVFQSVADAMDSSQTKNSNNSNSTAARDALSHERKNSRSNSLNIAASTTVDLDAGLNLRCWHDRMWLAMSGRTYEEYYVTTYKPPELNTTSQDDSEDSNSNDSNAANEEQSDTEHGRRAMSDIGANFKHNEDCNARLEEIKRSVEHFKQHQLELSTAIRASFLKLLQHQVEM